MGGHQYKAVLGKYFNTLMTSIEITVTIWCKGNSYIRQTGKSSPILEVPQLDMTIFYTSLNKQRTSRVIQQ